MANYGAHPQAATHARQRWQWWLPQADGQAPAGADLAYVGRQQYGDHVAVHITGIHAIGSLRAVHYLAGHLPALYAETGDTSFSVVIRASYDGLAISGSSLIAGPFPW